MKYIINDMCRAEYKQWVGMVSKEKAPTEAGLHVECYLMFQRHSNYRRVQLEDSVSPEHTF